MAAIRSADTAIELAFRREFSRFGSEPILEKWLSPGRPGLSHGDAGLAAAVDLLPLRPQAGEERRAGLPLTRRGDAVARHLLGEDGVALEDPLGPPVDAGAAPDPAVLEAGLAGDSDLAWALVDFSTRPHTIR
jgi:hypothetical protein